MYACTSENDDWIVMMGTGLVCIGNDIKNGPVLQIWAARVGAK